MIKLAKLEILDGLTLRLTFADGRSGIWDAKPLLTSKATALTTPLLDPSAFARAFVEGGALAWPNGLELAPWMLYAEMDAAGLLTKAAA
ncbi:MAG: DUF2442 domain-containing protein [Sphingomonadales bacterium]|jgi:hypothetical protein|nr:DUF2442 domain-containing protein [Sphingomonadales bacterium]MBK9002388.1 DUF2442 domain-containing protein [Sphingomonadales bacterium]MBK9267618.1 DUF2442 domain-containing protein [Sphingomonadales bacterium]